MYIATFVAAIHAPNAKTHCSRTHTTMDINILMVICGPTHEQNIRDNQQRLHRYNYRCILHPNIWRQCVIQCNGSHANIIAGAQLVVHCIRDVQCNRAMALDCVVNYNFREKKKKRKRRLLLLLRAFRFFSYICRILSTDYVRSLVTCCNAGYCFVFVFWFDVNRGNVCIWMIW